MSEVPANGTFLWIVAGMAVLWAHGTGAANSKGIPYFRIVSSWTDLLTEAVGCQVETIPTLRTCGSTGALSTLLRARFTFTTHCSGAIGIEAFWTGLFTEMSAGQVQGALALRAIILRLALVTSRIADLAMPTNILNTFVIPAILAGGFTPVVVRQICRVSTFLTYCGAGAQAAVLCTKWASVANTTCRWKFPIAIRTEVLT